MTGGCPQGSILGVFLFNVTTDDLEDSSDYVSDPGADVPELVAVNGRPDPAGGREEEDDEQEHGALDAPPDEVDYSPYPDLRPTPEELLQDELEEQLEMLENLDDSADQSFHSALSSTTPVLLTSSLQARQPPVVGSLLGALSPLDTLNFEARSFILDKDGGRVESSGKMKVLGWHFSSKPTPAAYVEVLKRRFRERYWILRYLQHNGFTEQDLVRVYAAIVRPVAGYMMKVYHSMISDRQDEEIKRLQTHALHCIFGPGLSGRTMRSLASLLTLRERRIAACDRFAERAAASDRFGHWFPQGMGRTSSRTSEKYVEECARCSRLYNPPLFYMRRLLNGKEGRSYGSRNKE